MAKQTKGQWKTLLKTNYAQLFFVFTSFFLVILVSLFSHRSLTERNLRNGAAESLRTVEANIKASLHEPESTLISSSFAVQDMIAKGAPNSDVLSFFINMSTWLYGTEGRVSGSNGLYGVIRGEYLDGFGWTPPEDYVPEERPWYKGALDNPGQITATSPYLDALTGGIVISYAQELFDASGAHLGVIALDVLLVNVSAYIKNLMSAYGGYGTLQNSELRILVHPKAEMLDIPLASVSPQFAQIAEELEAGKEILGRVVVNNEGRKMIAFFYRLYNGWYVGMLIPAAAYYGDLYRADAIQISLAVILAFTLAYILLRLSAAKIHSDEENRQKSSFLANMSHEIRTPMNAIVGMSELLLRGNLGDDERSYAADIKQAGNNLISIINDILDFSKIESGKMEIIPVRYLLPSLVNDTVNIIRMRLMEKPVRFYTNIDPELPNGLTGDETHIRQIILNLLSNAAKYTQKGSISMSITGDRRDEKTIWLKIAVKDTGIGIRPEDMDKLFGDFVQVDTRKNRTVEGTGLGLAITKRLCQAMGGDIGVESEYGLGSIFTVIIPQGISSPQPFAEVNEPEKKPVLVYEARRIYADSVCWSLEQMGVPHTLVLEEAAFIEALGKKEWFFVFSGYGLYEKIESLWKRDATAFAGGKKPPLALMVEWGTEAYIPGVRFLSLPVQSLSISNILSGRPDRGYINTGNFDGTRFVIPGACLLVVDDIATNLKVAEGLLSPYRAAVDTCLSGAEAIELIKRRSYDIVFMDHMMPDMDGVETTVAIRALEGDYFKTVPVIALTANAVSGMKEMFLEKGFNDFLAKPIDVSKLDEILARWIPKNKQKKEEGGVGNNVQKTIKDEHNAGDGGLSIPGVDVRQGIAMTGGTEAGYRKVLAVFCKDAEERLPAFQTPEDGDSLAAFITQAHALKGASASICAAEVSALAAALERSGRAGDTAAISAALPEFTVRLASLVSGIKAALEVPAKNEAASAPAAPASGAAGAGADPDPAELKSLLKKLAGALDSGKAVDVERTMEALNRHNLSDSLKDILDQISDLVLLFEFEQASELLKTIQIQE